MDVNKLQIRKALGWVSESLMVLDCAWKSERSPWRRRLEIARAGVKGGRIEHSGSVAKGVSEAWLK